MLDGKSRPVYVTPDTTVFNDSDNYKPEIYYLDLLNLRGNFLNVVAFKKGMTNMAIIREPTFFLANDIVLIFPGEHIFVKKEEGQYYNNFTFSKVAGSKRRNKEFAFFKTYHKIIPSPFKPRVSNYSLDTIIELEKQLIKEIPKITATSRLIFDSLAKAYGVSKRFKKIARNYLENEYAASLFSLYKSYKDTLAVHDLYKKKCRELIPVFNRITERSKFVITSLAFNEMADIVLPYKIWKIQDEAEFRSCFDSVENNFTDLAKDYLLSQLMCRAYTRRIQVSSGYIEKYKTICSDKAYKKIVNNLISQQQQNDTRANLISNNSLLSVNGKKVISLENILDKYKGKLILVDFWTTWCAPCREEIPYWKKLIQEYPEDKIVFFSVSIDRDMQNWQKYVLANNTETNNHFLLINDKKSSFVKQYSINTIPRYILIGKQGEIINADAPSPSNPNLKELLDKYLPQ